jgi:dGTPase
LIDTFIRDLVQATEDQLEKGGFASSEQIADAGSVVATVSLEMGKRKKDLNQFLHTRFYTHHKIMRMQYKAYRLLRDLFEEYVKRPSQLPPGVQKKIKREQDPPDRVICDYIAGMTDRFALDEHRKLFLPYEY